MPFLQPSYNQQLGLYTSNEGIPQQRETTLSQQQQPWPSTSQLASALPTTSSTPDQSTASSRHASLRQVGSTSTAEMTTMAAPTSAAAQPPYFGAGPMSNEPGMPQSSMSWAMPSGQTAAVGAQGMGYHFGASSSGQIPPGAQGQNQFAGNFVPRRAGNEPYPNELSMQGYNDGSSHWAASPRNNLKRPGEESWDQGQLRRPASFPALPQQQQGGNGNYGEDARFQQQMSSQGTTPQMHHQQQPPISRSQTMNKIPTPTTGKSSLQDALGVHRQDSGSHMGYTHNLSPGQRGANIGPLSRGEVTPAFSTISTLPSTSPASSTHNRRESGLAYGFPGEEAHYMDQQYQQKNSPAMYHDSNITPQLMRATQVYVPPTSGAMTSAHSHTMSMSSSSSSPPGGASSLGSMPHLSQRAHLELHGNVHDMALGWSHDEWRSRRRLVQFWRKQEGTKIHAICKPILPEQYVPNSVVVSCIFWDVTNECYITSVDVIYLLEALVASRFNVEEKNRIRRNLEGLKPKTISKQPKNVDENLNRIHDEFFKLVMSFPNPKPRHIEKDIKIFPWRTLPAALNKIISKYSAAPLMAVAADQPPSFTTLPHIGSASNTPVPSEMSSFGTPTPGPGQWQQAHHQGHHLQPQMSHPSHGMPSQPQQGPGAQYGQHSPPQQHGMRRANPNLSIDVSASNSAVSGAPQPPGSASGFLNSLPGLAPFSARGSSSITSPAGNFLLPQPSPRRTPGMWGMSLTGSSTFNINDFVVSPSTFAQTPLQPMHNIGTGQGGMEQSSTSASNGNAGGNGNTSSQGGSASSAQTSSTARQGEGGLGINLGPYKQES